MKQNQILISGSVLLIVYLIYLSLMWKNVYKMLKTMHGIKIKFNILTAIICYLLLIFLLNYFTIDKKVPLFDASKVHPASINI